MAYAAIQEEKALRLLERALDYPGLPPKKRYRVSFRLWRYPAFEPYCSWTVIEDAGQYFVRRVVWDRLSNVISPEPETYGAEATIDKSVHDDLVSQLQTIQLPVFVPVNTIGIDGVINGIELGGYMASARLTWWCNPPAEWAAVQQWHRHAIEALDGILPLSTAHRTNAP